MPLLLRDLSFEYTVEAGSSKGTQTMLRNSRKTATISHEWFLMTVPVKIILLYRLYTQCYSYSCLMIRYMAIL